MLVTRVGRPRGRGPRLPQFERWPRRSLCHISDATSGRNVIFLPALTQFIRFFFSNCSILPVSAVCDPILPFSRPLRSCELWRRRLRGRQTRLRGIVVSKEVLEFFDQNPRELSIDGSKFVLFEEGSHGFQELHNAVFDEAYFHPRSADCDPLHETALAHLEKIFQWAAEKSAIYVGYHPTHHTWNYGAYFNRRADKKKVICVVATLPNTAVVATVFVIFEPQVVKDYCTLLGWPKP